MRGSTASIAEKAVQVAVNSRRSKKHDVVLTVLDTLISAIVIGPAVVAYWRGTWLLMDYYVFPNNPEHSSWASMVLGLFGHVIFTMFQCSLESAFHPDTHRLTYYIVSRIYTALFGIVCVNAWRGAWNALDFYTGKDIGAVVATTLLGTIALAGMRVLRNLSAPPFAVAIDDPQNYFQVATMFRLSKSQDVTLYTLDVVFSVFMVGNLVVFAWRGAWTLVDIFLYPDQPGLSALYSLILGYVVLVVAFCLQPAMKKVCSNLEGLAKLAVSDIYLLFAFVGTINVWRGVWNLLNEYFLPGTPLLSAWLTHGVCLVLLMLLNCSNSILVRGIFVDASEEGGDCVDFPVGYLTLFVQAKREMKQQRNGLHPTSKRKYEGETKSVNFQDQQQTNNTVGNHVLAHLLPSLTPTTLVSTKTTTASTASTGLQANPLGGEYVIQ